MIVYCGYNLQSVKIFLMDKVNQISLDSVLGQFSFQMLILDAFQMVAFEAVNEFSGEVKAPHG